MISVDDMIPALLEACPSAQVAWDEYVDEWRSEDVNVGFIDMAVFAHHIVESYTAGRIDEFPAFFALLEKFIREGEKYVVDLAVTGLIEDIQNISSHQDHGYKVFERWLGFGSRTQWFMVEAQWSGVSSLAEMIKRELS